MKYSLPFLVLLICTYLQQVIPIFSGVEGCQDNCEAADRLMGPTKMRNSRPHPWAVASFPTKNNGFCKLGCQYFFSDNPETTQCKAKCMGAYRYRITAEYSDAATEAQENCIDGCDIAIQVCQSGFFCKNGTSSNITMVSLENERVLMCYRDAGNSGSATCSVILPSGQNQGVVGLDKGKPLVVSARNPSPTDYIRVAYIKGISNNDLPYNRKPVVCYRDDLSGAPDKNTGLKSGKFGRCTQIYDGSVFVPPLTISEPENNALYVGEETDIKDIEFNTGETAFIDVTDIGTNALVCYKDVGGGGDGKCSSIIPQDPRLQVGSTVVVGSGNIESLSVTNLNDEGTRALTCYQDVTHRKLYCSSLSISSDGSIVTILVETEIDSVKDIDNIMVTKVYSNIGGDGGISVVCYRDKSITSQKSYCRNVNVVDDSTISLGTTITLLGGLKTDYTTITTLYHSSSIGSSGNVIVCLKEYSGSNDEDIRGVCSMLTVDTTTLVLAEGSPILFVASSADSISVAKVKSGYVMVCYQLSERRGLGTCTEMKFDIGSYTDSSKTNSLIINDNLMMPCPPGRYREPTLGMEQVKECLNCPAGRYRKSSHGKQPAGCSPCPIGKYAAVTGSVRVSDCLRCPAGRFADLEGMAVCVCITDGNLGSCNMSATQNGVVKQYFLDPDVVDYYRESIPYIGRS